MLKLLFVEDNEKLRPALKSGLEETGGVQVVHDCGTGEEAWEYCLAQPPEAILMDVQPLNRGGANRSSSEAVELLTDVHH